MQAATLAFVGTFEDPTSGVPEETRQAVEEIINSLGTPPTGAGTDTPTTQPAHIEISFEGKVNVGYGPLSVGGTVSYKFSGTPEQFRAHLQGLWDTFKDVLNDLKDGVLAIWNRLFGSPAPSLPGSGG
ncbi:MAG: hypothetical protein DCC75_01155 [Proteobacteria bacterium]|nr:MAG: hypothetical protein DCC75_01155 [Pseudomonadota bacterium]